MNPNHLDELLRSYFRQTPPLPSEQLAAEVWTEIRHRQKRSLWSRLTFIAHWPEVFAEPAIIGTACAVALAIGVVAPAMARGNAHSRLVRESLHFEVFSASRLSFIDRIAERPTAVPALLKP